MLTPDFANHGTRPNGFSLLQRLSNYNEAEFAEAEEPMRVRSSLLQRAFTAIFLVATFVRGGLAQNCAFDTVVRIIDKHGQPVANVAASELRAEINGNPANISSFSSSKPGII